ncbi:MAG: diaminopimelate decarboxylase [Azospirillaceae bacterium]
MDSLETRVPEAARVPAAEGLRFLEAEEVRRVAERFGTPCFVYDEATMLRRAAWFRALPTAFGTTVRYSIKANPNAAVLRLFDRAGLAFDASSEWEARRAIRAGVDPSKILLTAQEAGPGVDALIGEGLRFDAGSLEQLDRYGRAHPGTAVSVRINPGFGSGLVRRLTAGGAESSFGIWHADLDRVRALCQRHGLRVERLHVHIGSGHDPDVLLRTVDAVLAFAELFPDADTLDLGGGYRVRGRSDEPEPDTSAMARRVADRLGDHADRTGRRFHLEMEPGTALVANAGSLVARVIDIVSTGPEGHRFVKLDTGLSEIMRPSYYGTPHPLVAVPAADRPADRPADREADPEPVMVAGHCCIAGDVLTVRPGDVETLEAHPLAPVDIGDLVVVERAGGYCASMAVKNFNSYPESAEVLRRADGRLQVIRVRQSLDQIVANERMPADLG